MKVSKKARKSINKKTKKSFDKPSEMAPGKTRVIAPASGGSKRVLPGLNSDEHESARVTRQKTKLSLTNHEESLVQMDVGSPANVDEGSLHVHVDVRSSMHERSLMHGGEVSLMQMGERSLSHLLCAQISQLKFLSSLTNSLTNNGNWTLKPSNNNT